MKTGHKVLIGAGFFIGLLAYLGYNKFQRLKKVFEYINIELVGIKNLKISNKSIDFNVNVKFVNRSSEDFSINSSLVKLKTLNFYYKGKFVGTAHPNLVQISIPKYNELVVENIPATIPVSAIFSNLNEILSFNADYITIDAIVMVAGYEFIIKP